MADFVINDSTNNDLLFDVKIEGEVKGRGHDENQVQHFMFAPPSEIPLIPESEWIPRIRDRKKYKTGLRDLFKTGRVGTVKDQNGQGYCATADTEILTVNGFVPYPEYNWTDPVGTVNPITHAMEFQRPFERHVYAYDGPMIYSTNRRIDFGVTPDHQMYVRKWDESRRTLSPNYSFVRAADMGWYCGLLHAPSGQIGTELVELEIPGDRTYDGDDFLALLGLVVSDGYAGGAESTKNWVSFASFRDDVRPAIVALAARTGFRESPSRRGVWVRYNAGALAAWLRENAYVGSRTGSQSKQVPDIVKCASVRQIKNFLHWFDDRSRDGSQFYSSSKRLIDDLQELFLRIGKRSHIGTSRAKESVCNGKIVRSTGGYVLTVGAVDQLCLDKKKHIETDNYKGLVYCAAVPNHTLITRRNGSVLISSNCWSYSVTRSAEYVRAIMNQEHVSLSAHSLACKVKGFRDEGGWCGLAAQFFRANGCVPESMWPAKSMSRSNDTPTAWEEAKKYRIIEDFVDLASPVYDQNLTFAQVVSCLLQNIPVVLDYNWWGHSICGVDVDERDGEVCPDIDNSWTPSWGDDGTGLIQGNRRFPDGSVATRVLHPA